MLKFLGAITVLFINILVSGYVLSMLWGWFMVTIFALPALSLLQALGVSTTIRFITTTSLDVDSNKSYADRMLTAFIYYGIVLLTGFIIHVNM